MTALGALLLAEMALNAAISALWAWGAFVAARRRAPSPVRWPVPWRWLVFAWMGTKRLLFFAIVAELVGDVPPAVAGAVAAAFTVAHTAAFIRWARLPAGGGESRDAR